MRPIVREWFAWLRKNQCWVFFKRETGLLSNLLHQRRLLSALFLLVLMGLLSACYPKYNWRELSVADGLAVAAFPSRVDTAQREIVLNDMKLTFELTSATIDKTVFSVGYSQLPMDSTPAQRQEAQRAMVMSLASAMGQPLPEEAFAGEAFVLKSLEAQTPLVMHARVVLYYDVVIRQIAAGPIEELTPEIAQEFMRSFKIR
jgi:hypothetical protein